MNLPSFRFSKPSFSPRFLIYFLFGLIVLALVAEGGYYFYYCFLHQFDGRTIMGTVKAKEGRVLLIEQVNNSGGKKIRVEVAPNAEFFKRTAFGGSKLPSVPDFLNDLDIDDIVILLEMRPRLLREPIVTKIILFQPRPEV